MSPQHVFEIGGALPGWPAYKLPVRRRSSRYLYPMSYTSLHTADIHLGHRQYNVDDRETDMYLSFRQTLVDAVDQDVDVILIPGDLFDSRGLPLTILRAAERAL